MPGQNWRSVRWNGVLGIRIKFFLSLPIYLYFSSFLSEMKWLKNLHFPSSKRWPSNCLSIYSSIYLFIYLSIFLFVCQSIYLSVCQSIFLHSVPLCTLWAASLYSASPVGNCPAPKISKTFEWEPEIFCLESRRTIRRSRGQNSRDSMTYCNT